MKVPVRRLPYYEGTLRVDGETAASPMWRCRGAGSPIIQQELNLSPNSARRQHLSRPRTGDRRSFVDRKASLEAARGLLNVSASNSDRRRASGSCGWGTTASSRSLRPSPWKRGILIMDETDLGAFARRVSAPLQDHAATRGRRRRQHLYSHRIDE